MEKKIKIFPAIDLSGGKVVRLFQGDYDKLTVYGDDPLAPALEFKVAGAEYLHVVDLDGAKDGTPVNFDAIKRLAGNASLYIEVGGGIRTEERINQYLELGVGRVILGTIAVRDFDFTCRMIKKYGDQIAVGVDARDGKVAVSGWLEKTDVDAVEFVKRLREAGCSAVIFTDISRDGAEKGTNLEIYRKLRAQSDIQITASGGVSSIEEILTLQQDGIDAAILGKALYTGRLKLADVLKAL